jgi:pimeloyl-ACP methyl ester carboxylesterase
MTALPHGVTESVITLPSGVRINYLRAGRRPRGRAGVRMETVLLVHGIGHSCRAWDRVIPALAQEYDVVALDLPGGGKSDKPPTDYSLGNQAGAIRHFLDELGLDRVTIVGHSLGGGVAMTFSYLYPERINRMALVSSAGLGRELGGIFRAANLPVAPRYVMRALFHPRARLARNVVSELAFRAGADPLFARQGEFAEETADWLLDMEDPATQAAFLNMLRASSNVRGQAISALDRLHLAERYPVLIVWGAQDRVFPVSHARRAARVLPSARVEVFQGCGHVPQVEMPDEFAAVVLDWLRTTRAARLDRAPRRRAA